MKLSQTTLKKLIQEELSKLNEDEGKKLTHAKAKEYFLNAAAKVSDIDSNALDELTKMLELVTRAFTGNVNTSPMNIGLDQALKRAKDEEEERSPLGES